MAAASFLSRKLKEKEQGLVYEPTDEMVDAK